MKYTNWQELQKELSDRFNTEVDINGMLLLVGIREKGLPLQEFSKEEKLNLMQLGSCHLLSEIGWTKKVAVDRDGWPVYHERPTENPLSEEQKKLLLIEAALQYFSRIFSE